MSLYETMMEFLDEEDSVERCAFKEAFLRKIEKEPVYVIDLIFELYQCQRRLSDLEEIFLLSDNFELEEVKKPKKAKSPKKKEWKNLGI